MSTSLPGGCANSAGNWFATNTVFVLIYLNTMQVQQFKSGFDENKLKIRALENELLLTAKQLEEERSRQKDLKKKVDEFEEEKRLRSQEYEDKIALVKEDMEELKSRLVTVTRYAAR